MKVKLRNRRPSSEETTLELEAAMGYCLSDSFRTFLLSHDGSEPEPNIFKISQKDDSGVNGLIPANRIHKERSRIRNIPSKAYPIAWLEGGNYAYIDEGKNGAVFFWDHELPENIIRLADDFNSFLELLEPFDIRTIELKPGQVIRGWIDPEFLKKQKK